MRIAGAILLVLLAVSHGGGAVCASPHAPRTATPPGSSGATERGDARAALGLEPEQARRIRAIIARDRRRGLPTVATRRHVLHVLSAAQRARLHALLAPATPEAGAAPSLTRRR